MPIPILHKETSLFSKVKSISSTFSVLADSITSIVSGSESYIGPDGESHTNVMASMIRQNAADILLRVQKNGVIAAINASAEEEGGSSVKIRADKVQIDGRAIFSAISSDVDDAITDKGYATTDEAESYASSAQQNAKNYVDGKGYQTRSDVTSAITAGIAGKADKTGAVRKTQRIWYRSDSGTKPQTPGDSSSDWVTKTDDGNNAWTRMHVAITSTHKYIYTCEQYELASGTVGYTTVLRDNTITVIDGGNILTNSVTATQIDATNLHVRAANIDGSLTIGKVSGLQDSLDGKQPSGDYATNDSVAEATGEISDQLQAVSSSIPSSVSELEDDVGIVTSSELGDTITEVEGRLGDDIANVTSEISGELQAVSNSIPSSVSELEDDVGIVTTSELGDTITEVEGRLGNDIAEARKVAENYLAYDTATNELTIGVTNADGTRGLHNVISNSIMTFVSGSGEDMAHFGEVNDIWEMAIATARIGSQLRFNDFAWIRRENGNMTLKWLGSAGA